MKSKEITNSQIRRRASLERDKNRKGKGSERKRIECGQKGG